MIKSAPCGRITQQLALYLCSVNHVSAQEGESPCQDNRFRFTDTRLDYLNLRSFKEQANHWHKIRPWERAQCRRAEHKGLSSDIFTYTSMMQCLLIAWLNLSTQVFSYSLSQQQAYNQGTRVYLTYEHRRQLLMLFGLQERLYNGMRLRLYDQHPFLIVYI